MIAVTQGTLPVKRWIVPLLLLLLPGAAAAQQWEDYDYENLEFRGLGLDFGMVWPASVEPTLMFGARADLGTSARSCGSCRPSATGARRCATAR
jgi:hypothetical protein